MCLIYRTQCFQRKTINVSLFYVLRSKLNINISVHPNRTYNAVRIENFLTHINAYPQGTKFEPSASLNFTFSQVLIKSLTTSSHSSILFHKNIFFKLPTKKISPFTKFQFTTIPK